MRFLHYLNEAESSIRTQLESIKNGTGEWDAILRSWITGKESSFTKVGAGRFYFMVPKEVPKEVKLKYPDIIFAIHALQSHMGGEIYYKKWEEAKKFLSFKAKDVAKTYYRFWEISEEDLQKLKSGKSLKFQETKPSLSYTRWNKLFSKRSGITVMNIATERLLKTSGQALTLVTKHTFVPVFDLFYFLAHLLNAANAIFGKENVRGFPDKYMGEREVIGPGISEIKPEEVVGYYKSGTFNELTGEEYVMKIEGRTFTLLPQNIESIKQGYKEYGAVDRTLFNNSLLITTDPENSTLKRYGKFEFNKELSKRTGIKVYTGVWA